MKLDVDANDDSVSKILIELQSLARGSITRQNLFNSLRSELNSLRDKTNLSNTKLLKIGLAITNNSFRIDGTEKEACILLFCDLFVRSMQSSTISESFASLFLSTNFMTSSCKLATRLTETILSIIAGANVTKISEARKVVGLISALHLLCSCQCWPILKKKPEIVSIIETLCSKILINMANKESISVLMRTITASLKGSRQQLNEGTVDQIFSIILRFLQIAQLGSDESCQIFIDLLKIPTITIMLTDDSFHLAEKCNHFELSLNWLVSHCQHEMSTTISQLTTNEALNLLSNMIFLGNKYKNTQLSFLLNWAYLVSQLLKHCSRVASDKKKSNCWHHPLLGWTTERLEDSFKWTFPRLRHQIAMLWSREMVQYLSANFLLTKSKSTAEEDQEEKMRKSSKSATYSSNTLSGEKLPAEFLQRFIGRIAARTCSKKHPDSIGNFPPVPLPPISLPVILCQLYRNALFTFQNSRIDILSNLSRDDSLVLVKLWHFIRFELDERDGLNAYLGYLVTDPDVIAPQFTPLQLFGDIAYSLISILDEKEMYESEKPFSRQQLCQIAKFTNRFCFHTICDSLIDFEKKRPAALFNSIYQLLVIMYNRDCRRPFTVDQNFWTISELNPKSFIAEFERSRPSQRAHVLMEKMPHIIPLRDRIFMFRRFIAQEKDSNLPMTIITVERSRLVEDGYRQLGGLSGQALRGTIRVKFINQQGLDEAGIDQDGVFKEFLELTLKQVFTPELNLFKCSHDKLLYPASTSSIQENHLELFNFVGRMLGKAVYEGICVDIQLAPVLLAAVLGKQLCPFDELASLDPLLYKNLTYLKHYTEDVEELSLTFSFSEEFLGKIYTYELVPGGRDLKVNNENKISYLHLMAHSRVVKQIREQTKSFVNGFRSIINEKCLSLFSIHELQFLISGQLSDIDLEDLRKHVQYYGGFHNNHRLIRWLWSILEEDFSAEERQLFLKFVTSCSRPPILGFAYLEPSFSIRCVETSEDQDQGDTLGSVIRGFLAINKKKLPVNERLPTASTCFNLLKLPNYTKRSILLAKLRYAIHAETGFELS